jgi:hypothetical protein
MSVLSEVFHGDEMVFSIPERGSAHMVGLMSNVNS